MDKYAVAPSSANNNNTMHEDKTKPTQNKGISMKKYHRIFIFLTLILMIFGCTKELLNKQDISIESTKTKHSNKIIKIHTDKNIYSPGEMIHVKIKSNLSQTAYHYSCDDVNLKPSHILSYVNGKWQEEAKYYICTTLGPMGFWGKLENIYAKEDSLYINKKGLFTLKYTFIVEPDTLYIESNEFEIK